MTLVKCIKQMPQKKRNKYQEIYIPVTTHNTANENCLTSNLSLDSPSLVVCKIYLFTCSIK